MNHKILFFLGILLAVVGCASEGKRLKTDSGYEYQIIRKGSSDPIPVNSYLFFNMDLAYKDSVMQTSRNSQQRPVIKILEEKRDYGVLTSLVTLMGKMHVGDSFLFYFPVDSFTQMPPGFEKFTEPVVYRVGLTEVMDDATFEKYSDSLQQAQEVVRQAVRDRLPVIEGMTKITWEAYKKGELNPQIQSTPSGLKYLVQENGDGPKPNKGEQVSVHYYGMLASDGTMFDNSFGRGSPYTFPLGQGQVIQGWDEGLQLLNKGSKAVLFIPPALAYGAAGSPPRIPENAELIFYVELEK